MNLIMLYDIMNVFRIIYDPICTWLLHNFMPWHTRRRRSYKPTAQWLTYWEKFRYCTVRRIYISKINYNYWIFQILTTLQYLIAYKWCMQHKTRQSFFLPIIPLRLNWYTQNSKIFQHFEWTQKRITALKKN